MTPLGRRLSAASWLRPLARRPRFAGETTKKLCPLLIRKVRIRELRPTHDLFATWLVVLSFVFTVSTLANLGKLLVFSLQIICGASHVENSTTEPSTWTPNGTSSTSEPCEYLHQLCTLLNRVEERSSVDHRLKARVLVY